jgi:ABC-type glycerol-3-phosphate transport system substrate-binding protein
MTSFLVKNLLIIALLFVVLSWQANAQESGQVVLSVLLPPETQYLEGGTTFADFEALHPNVEVNIIYETSQLDDVIPDPVYGIEEHLDMVDALTNKADVVVMSVGGGLRQLSLEATRAGYILDLMPLFNASSTADASVYYPTVWQAAQWEGGLWILPTSAVISAIDYNPSAFNDAGLAYPDASWDLDDFANAANVLAIRDATGKVTTPGLLGSDYDIAALFYNFLDHPLHDASMFPSVPNFLQPDTLALADVWLPSLTTGAIFDYRYDYGNHDFQLSNVPLRVNPMSRAYLNNREIAPLPRGLVNINGFAVSSRTLYPELAYELAMYLAADIVVADAMSNIWGGMSLARPQYPNIESTAGDYFRIDTPTDEARLLMDAALTNGIPASELLYYPYFQLALFQAATIDLDVETALGDAEILAKDNLAIAESRRTEIADNIPTPIPAITLAPDEIELTFYHQEGDSTLWQVFADEFVANDPEVGRVIIQRPFSAFNFRKEGTDCFYSYNNLSPATDDYDYVIDIAPLLAADGDFVAEDWLPSVFDTVREGESIYALPMDIRPFALWYDANQLELQGVLPPLTNSELHDALKTLDNSDGASLSTFKLDTTLLMLIASQGAIPINYSGDSVQIDFTSENSVATIQRVLDLARDGTLKYGSLTDFSSSSFPENEPFMTDIVVDSMFRDDDYLPIAFPAGNQYTPVAYSLMAGYISRFSQHPEACYRLLRSLSHRTDLLGGVPAQRSEAIRSEYSAFYAEFNQQLNAPNLVVIQGNYTGNAHSVTYWLYRAFDRYVLEDADLLSELSIAEQFTNEYLLCVENGGDSYDCALQVDPTIGT